MLNNYTEFKSGDNLLEIASLYEELVKIALYRWNYIVIVVLVYCLLK